ncbi:TRAP transporter substrate-binding protein [Desulfovibrio sp. OttesenSCG-928-O18]|nr:TRAP transporter substrate-binding protein [Desulfovibrio sp. OttesenSCG-928-O18]
MMRLIRLVTACALVLLMAAPAFAAQTMRMSSNFPVDHASSQALDVFKKKVEEYSKGEIIINNFPAMQLGGAAENIDQTRSGVTFGTVLSAAFMTRTVPELEALGLPFVFDNMGQMLNALDAGLDKVFNEKLLAKGFVTLGYFNNGSRHLTNNKRAVKKLEDFQGLKIRLMPSATHLDTFRALGANPVAMDISEVYQALQQGVLDGQENPYPVIQSRNFNEVQKFVTATNHFADVNVVIVNKKQFESLSPALQEAVRKAMKEAVAWQREKAEKDADIAKDTLIKAGMQFNEITPEDRAALKKATMPVIDGLRKKLGAELIDAVLKAAEAK